MVDSRASRRDKPDLSDVTIFLEDFLDDFLKDEASIGTFDILPCRYRLAVGRISSRCMVYLNDSTREPKPDSDHSRGDSSMIGHRIVRL